MLDVKTRQSDRKVDEQMQTADMVEVYSRPHDVEQHSAEVGLRKGAQQVAASREPGERTAVRIVRAVRSGWSFRAPRLPPTRAAIDLPRRQAMARVAVVPRRVDSAARRLEHFDEGES